MLRLDLVAGLCNVDLNVRDSVGVLCKVCKERNKKLMWYGKQMYSRTCFIYHFM